MKLKIVKSMIMFALALSTAMPMVGMDSDGPVESETTELTTLLGKPEDGAQIELKLLENATHTCKSCKRVLVAAQFSQRAEDLESGLVCNDCLNQLREAQDTAAILQTMLAPQLHQLQQQRLVIEQNDAARESRSLRIAIAASCICVSAVGGFLGWAIKLHAS